MPQLDKYIFLNQVLALIFFFFLTYIYIRSTVIPNLNMSLKYRHKSFAMLFSHDRGNWALFKKNKASVGAYAVTQLNFINSQLTTIFSHYKIKYNTNFILLLQTYFSSRNLFFIIKSFSITNNKLSNFITDNFWLYIKYNKTSLNLNSIFSKKKFSFFTQEQFNQFFFKEIVRSTYFLKN